jgi:hypothetical protein
VVCVRAHGDGGPPEDAVFDRIVLTATGRRWHALVYTHRKGAASLSVDGGPPQTLATLTYPREGMWGVLLRCATRGG